MGFKNFKFNIIFRVFLLILSIFLLAHLFYNGSYTLTKILVISLIVFQVYSIIYFLEKTNREIVGFLSAIKYDDFSNTYTEKGEGSGFDSLYEEFNQVVRKFREIRADKEAQHQYLKTIVQHVGIGIITFDSGGEIQIFNTAAKRLLGVSQIKNIKQLAEVSAPLVDSFQMLKTGGRDLIKIEKNNDEVQLAIYAIELTLRGKEFKLISIQNIKSELEEKEMEAWQNLIRVLTHEIMNSVTPISSLAATVEHEIESQLAENLEMNEISAEELEDLYLATSTIHKRSEGLIKFVTDFRNLTRLPAPNLQETHIKTLIGNILVLLKFDIEKSGIDLKCNIDENLFINLDKEQIEQVLINLIKNAIQALAEEDEEEVSKVLSISAQRQNGSSYVVIGDNGPGIDEDAIKKIFIPFFTTKKSGSGIGLSLSKQIMRRHNGNITVKSVIDEGTEFTLSFNN